MFFFAILSMSACFLRDDVRFVLLSAAPLVYSAKILLPEGVVSLVGLVTRLCQTSQAVYIL